MSSWKPESDDPDRKQPQRARLGGLLAFSRTTLHPLFAVAVPLLFLVSFTAFLALFFGDGLKMPTLFYIILILSGLEEVIMGNILFKERTTGLARFRELIYLCVGVALLLFVAQKGNMAARIAALQNVRYILMFLAAPAQWLLSVYIHNALREREFLLQSVEGKQGTDLKTSLRQNAEQAREALSALGKVRYLLLFFQAVVFILMILAFALGRRPPPGLVAAVSLHTLSGILILVVLNNARDDQLLFGDGINVDFAFQRRRFVLAVGIILFAVLLIFIFARGSSTLPLSIFQSLLDWLSRLVRPRDAKPEPLPKPPEETSGQAEMLRMLQEFDETETKPWVETLLRILGRLLLGAAAAAVAYFLLAPLFSRYFRSRITSLHPLKALMRRVSGFFTWARGLLDELRDWMKQSKTYAADRRRLEREEKRLSKMKSRSPGLFKRIEIGRILKAYLRLIKWGQKRGVPFKRYLAPQEYTGKLSNAVPSQREALGEAVGILEEALFSPALIERKKFSRCLFLVKQIVKERR